MRVNLMRVPSHSLLIQRLASIATGGDQHSYEMCESALPNPEFKLVHEVGHEQLINVASERCKLLQEGGLRGL